MYPAQVSILAGDVMARLSADVLIRRIACAEQYFNALIEYTVYDWQELYQRYVDGEINFPKTYALLWPERYVELGINQESICGGRTFLQMHTRELEACQSNVIWGYECTNANGTKPHADHLFPYGLGGITDSRNQIYLCDRHNFAKGSDFHLYPWERGQQSWVAEIINRINDAVNVKLQSF